MPSDTHKLLRRAGDEFARIVGQIPAGCWREITPIEITVREVVDHCVAGNIFADRLLGGADVAAATAGLGSDLLGDDPVAAVASSQEGQEAAFASAAPDRRLHHPSGDIDLNTFYRFRVGELVVHGWDVAVAAGLDAQLDCESVRDLWHMVSPHVDEMRTMGTFGDGASNELPRDTALHLRLLDAFGRRP